MPFAAEALDSAPPGSNEIFPPEIPAADGEPRDDEESDAIISEMSGEAETDAGIEPAPEIAPPQSWDSEARAKFALLPRDVQEVIATREAARDRAISMALQEAAEARKRGQSDLTRIAEAKAAMDRVLPAAEAAFTRWRSVDWAKLTDEVGVAEAFKLRSQYESEQAQLQELRTAYQAASAETHRAYISGEVQRLGDVAPDLADAKEGASRREAVGRFLVQQGVPESALPYISAVEMGIAYDAMRYRAAKNSPAAKPKPAGMGTRSVVRPSSAPSPASSKTKEIERLAARLERSRSMDDAVALMIAKDK